MPARQISIAKALIRRRSDGAYLTLRRSRWEDRPELSQQPDLAGGTVEAGESFIEACRREVAEEVGLDITEQDLKLIYTQTKYFAPDNVSVNRALFYAQVGDDPIELSWEHDDYQWMSLDELSQLGLRSHWQEPIDYARQHGLID